MFGFRSILGAEPTWRALAENAFLAQLGRPTAICYGAHCCTSFDDAVSAVSYETTRIYDPSQHCRSVVEWC